MDTVNNSNVVAKSANSGTSQYEEKLLLPLPKWKVWYVMIIIFLLMFFDYTTRQAVAPLFPLIKKEFDLSDAQLGLISAVTQLAIGLLAIPLSYVIDRWRRGKMISLMAIVWSIASLFSGLASNFTMLLTGRAMLGVGEASYNSGAQTMIMATINRHRRATVTGFLFTGMVLGIAGGMVLGGWLGQSYGWRNTFMILAVPGIVLALLAWFIPDYKNQSKANEQGFSGAGFRATLAALITNKSVVTLTISAILVTFANYTVLTWFPTYLTRYADMNVATAGAMSGLVLLFGLVGMPLGGWLGDLVSRRNPKYKIIVIGISTLVAGVGQVFALWLNMWPLFILSTLGIFMLQPCQQILFQELVPSYQRASVYGFWFGVTLLLGSFPAPYVIGAISDATNLKVAFWVSAGVSTLAVFGYPLVYGFFNKDYAQARKKEQEVIAIT